MNLTSFVYQSFATATLITHLLIIGLLLIFFLRKTYKQAVYFFDFFHENTYNFVFVATFLATLESLYFSDIAHFVPCVLCWYQRIFMYPQVLLTALGIFREETRYLKPYLLALNIGGAAISLYHNFILWFPQYAEIVNCSTKGGTSCIKGYMFYYGYISLPLMALTAFMFNIVILSLFENKKNQRTKLMN